jgi:hypothetical protein
MKLNTERFSAMEVNPKSKTPNPETLNPKPS